MHPAPSVILFTVLSGLGFGFLAFLALGLPSLSGLAGLAVWGLGYGLAVSGLVASTFHLGNPQRALRAFTQWRSSWLSREAWAACVTLLWLAPVALSAVAGFGLPRAVGIAAGIVGAAMCMVTVFSTAMIYAQLRSIPRWNHWLTPVSFPAFAVTGGAVLAGRGWLAALCCAALAVVLVAVWRVGDGRFAAVGQTLGKATGLDRLGRPAVFEQPHTGGNYLLREMIHVVGRRHAQRLRLVALVLAALVPGLCAAILPPLWAAVIGGASHLVGALAARWLFFAEAEHVVGLYYGAHQTPG